MAIFVLKEEIVCTMLENPVPKISMVLQLPSNPRSWILFVAEECGAVFCSLLPCCWLWLCDCCLLNKNIKIVSSPLKTILRWRDVLLILLPEQLPGMHNLMTNDWGQLGEGQHLYCLGRVSSVSLSAFHLENAGQRSCLAEEISAW